MGYYTVSQYRGRRPRGDFYHRPRKGDYYSQRGDDGAPYFDPGQSDYVTADPTGLGGLAPGESNLFGGGGSVGEMEAAGPGNAVALVGSPPTGFLNPATWSSIADQVKAAWRTKSLGPLQLSGAGPAAPARTVMLRAPSGGTTTGGSTHMAFRRVDSWEVRDRRVMNPLNPHALRRSIRRGRAFQRFAMKQLRLEGIHRKVKGFKKKVGKR